MSRSSADRGTFSFSPLTQLSFLLLFSTLLLSSTTNLARADQFGSKSVTMNEVFVQTETIRLEIELLRKEMGYAPKAEQKLPIMGIRLQEVWFLASMLYQRSDVLAFELTRNHYDAPALPRGEIIPSDVMKVLSATLKRIREAKLAMGITDVVSVEEPESQKFPIDIFNTITQSSRLLNDLTERPITDSDIYREVTVAIQYSAILLSEYEDVLIRIPPEPPYQRFKASLDVFERLLQCLSITRTVYKHLGLSLLAIDPAAVSAMEVTREDVFDIAIVLVAQLDFLVRRREFDVDLKGYYPGRKIPSDIYQRIGVLDQQLKTLSKKSNRRSASE